MPMKSPGIPETPQHQFDERKAVLRLLRICETGDHLPGEFRCFRAFPLLLQCRRQLIDRKGIRTQLHHVAERFSRKCVVPGTHRTFADDGIRLAGSRLRQVPYSGDHPVIGQQG